MKTPTHPGIRSGRFPADRGGKYVKMEMRTGGNIFNYTGDLKQFGIIIKSKRFTDWVFLPEIFLLRYFW